MIDHTEFTEIMGRMELATEELDPEKAGVYFDRLKNQNYITLRKAVTILLDNYKYKRFPTIAEILDACKDADRAIAWAIAKERREIEGDLECEKCHGTGWVTVEYFEPLYQAAHEKAVNCECRIGQDRYAAWKRSPDRELPALKDRVYENIGND